MIVVQATEITIGEHIEGSIFGVTVNLDTIWSTLIAGIVVLALGLWARKQLTRDPDDHVPTKLQLFWESIVKEVTVQVESNIGRVHPYIVPLAIALFFFILLANWLEIIPTELNEEAHLAPAPTADTNLTYALALLVIVSTWFYGIQQRGFRGYFGGFLSGSIAKNPLIDIPARGFFTFLNVLEELIKPVTLALRLFGNIFAGGIMLSLIAALITWQVGVIPVGGVLGFFFNILWKGFDMFIGGVQAFIFALLTVLYFSMAASGHGDDEEHEDHEASDEQETDQAPDRELQPAR